MECRNCPYIKEQLDIKMGHYQNYINAHGIPNDIWWDMNYEEVLDSEVQYCYCGKMGNKLWYGTCEDLYIIEKKQKSHSKRKRRNKRERDLKHKNYLKRMCKTNHKFPVYYNDRLVIHDDYKIKFIDNPNPYYKRFYRGKRSKYLKRQSNKKIRKYKGEIPNGFGCHKLFDFWWEMY